MNLVSFFTDFKRFLSLLFTIILPALHLNSQIIPSHSVMCREAQKRGYYFSGLLKVDEAFSQFGQHHLIFNSAGELVYFKKFPEGKLTCDFRLQANGLISYFYKGKFYLMDSTFAVVDSVYPRNNLLKDAHELLLLENGNYLLLANEEQIMDLSAYHVFGPDKLPGSKRAIVRSGVIQEQDKSGKVVFEWHSKNYCDFSDVDFYYLKDTLNVDWNHFNSVEVDCDGNLLVSVRYFNEITKVSRKDSSIIWRLGGKKNQFQFVNDPQGFIAQHDARRTPSGTLTLFDNGRPGVPFHAAAAKEYRLNEKKRRIKLTWSYVDNSEAYSLYSGSVRRMSNGNVLINYGSSNKSPVLFNVVNSYGEKIFEVMFTDTTLGSYRTFYYESLPWKLSQPQIRSFTENGKRFLTVNGDYDSYLWSNGSTEKTIACPESGSYFVCVRKNSGYVCSRPFDVGANTVRD